MNGVSYRVPSYTYIQKILKKADITKEQYNKVEELGTHMMAGSRIVFVDETTVNL
jgi:hypothetical protein